MLTEFPQVQAGQQVVTFLLAMGLGAVLCLVYDLFRCVRVAFSLPAAMVFLGDVFFFALAALVVFCFLLIRCDGVFRIYVLLGCLMGASVCRFTASRLVFGLFTRVLLGIKAFFVRLFRPVAVRIRQRPKGTKKPRKNILKRTKKPLENGIPDDV